jgi:hypothetical protein
MCDALKAVWYAAGYASLSSQTEACGIQHVRCVCLGDVSCFWPLAATEMTSL